MHLAALNSRTCILAMLFHADQLDTFGCPPFRVEACQLENLLEDAQLLISTVEGHVHVLPDARDVLLEGRPCGSFLWVPMWCLPLFGYLPLFTER